MSAEGTATSPRRPGRPRSVACDRAILDATVDLLAEHGYDGLTLDGVAARAGVGKATIYRRWPTKIDLVLAAVDHCGEQPLDPPDSGDLRADLRELVRALAEILTTTDLGRLVPSLIAEMSRNPELADANRAFVTERRQRARAVVRREIERGRLRSDADVGAVLDALAAPIFFRYLVSRESIDDEYVEQVVDAAMRAYGTESASASS